MARYSSLEHAQLAVQLHVGGSRHRKARVLRFIFRHRKAHRRIIPDLIKAQQKHQKLRAAYFRSMQLRAIPRYAELVERALAEAQANPTQQKGVVHG